MPCLRSVELLSHLNTSAVVLLAGAFLLGVFFVYVYQQKRQAYLLVWAIAWFLLRSLSYAPHSSVRSHSPYGLTSSTNG